MLDKKLLDLMNVQINKELESAYLYLDFANYLTENRLDGFAHWYKIQAKEEIEHAERFIDYIHGETETVVLNAIDKVESKIDGVKSILNAGLEHERYVTDLINNIYKEADALHDYRTLNFLEWFIEEQAEEERNAQMLIDKYDKFVCDCGCGLYELDREFGKRTE